MIVVGEDTIVVNLSQNCSIFKQFCKRSGRFARYSLAYNWYVTLHFLFFLDTQKETKNVKAASKKP